MNRSNSVSESKEMMSDELTLLKEIIDINNLNTCHRNFLWSNHGLIMSELDDIKKKVKLKWNVGGMRLENDHNEHKSFTFIGGGGQGLVYGLKFHKSYVAKISYVPGYTDETAFYQRAYF
jgi:hypothetical protein